MSKTFHYFFSFLLGGISVLGFSPFEITTLLVLSFSGLIYICWKSSHQESFFCGLAFGIGYFGFGVHWVFYSIHTFGHAPLLFSLFMTFLFALYLTFFIAISCFFTNKYFYSKTLLYYVFAWTSLFVFFEWLRSLLFTGFPWLLVGQSSLGSSFSGYLPLGGVFLTSFIILIFSAFLLCAFLSLNKKRIYYLALLVLWFSGFQLNSVEWTAPLNKSLSISIVQPNIAQDIKWQKENRTKIMLDHYNLTNASPHSDIILWPEAAIPAYYHQLKDNYFNTIQANLTQKGTSLVTGVFYYDKENSLAYNSLINIQNSQLYKKRHLVPFGEYLPFRKFFSFIHDYVTIPMSDIAEGDSVPIIPINNTQAGVTICYEDIFPQLTLDAMPNAQYLINVSNDGWFGFSFAADQHLQMSRLRATETERYMVRATNTGISAVIDHKGRVIKKLAMNQKGILSSKIMLRKGVTPYVSLQGYLFFIIMFLIFAVLFLRRAHYIAR
jgi:apolipoprotein N-acyltransferase